MTRPAIRLIGNANAYAALAGALTAAGFPLWLAPTWQQQSPVDARRAETLTDALISRLRATQPAARLRCSSHWSQPDSPHPALSVLVSATTEIDRAVCEQLRRAKAAYLPVVLDGTRAQIGPLVAPEVTGCLSCRDYAMREVDPGWPRYVLEQSTQLVREPASLITSWACGQVVLAAHAYLRLGYCDLTDYQLECDLGDPLTKARPWQAHPDCPCRAL